jgi:hypothetical protein
MLNRYWFVVLVVVVCGVGVKMGAACSISSGLLLRGRRPIARWQKR